MTKRLAKDAVLHAAAVTRSVAHLGESPLWDDQAGLYWVDIAGQQLFNKNLDGVDSTIALSRKTTSIGLGPHQKLLAVTSTGFGWLHASTGTVEQKLHVYATDSITMNDSAIDERGRCWAGSAGRDGSQRGTLYRLDEQGIAAKVRHLGMSNGMDWSPGGDILYHVDSTAGTVIAREYDMGSGELGESRIHCSVPAKAGLPDGLTVDAEGDIWLAVWGLGQVCRLDANTGQVTATVEVPTPYTTSCTFGGPDLSTLYITTANYRPSAGGGLLYAAELPVHGHHANRFGGALWRGREPAEHSGQ
ncbi:SMP-30/gluconolactonase/LRE family protein [Qaidamihabitans albus]|uniref:SMP-30/gluconolactonase/LRE family protein n=1 Tax=Qaidamihabitans albus TaxID=2795733 RepID=UPI0018F18661|nr:SMP-30/gluconolactonase/LRE family protein [Qaidamihabitans albus]